MDTFKNIATGVELPDHKLVFFAAPKVASSSIKRMFYEHRHNRPVPEKNEDGGNFRIHQDFSSTRRFYSIPEGKYDGWTKITLVRDPVERLLSAFANRVVEMKILSEKFIEAKEFEKLGLKMNPPVFHFVRNLDRYRILSRPIWHHTDPFTAFLGHDLDYFDHIFAFNQLAELVDFVSVFTGKKATLPKATNGVKVKSKFEELGIEGRKSLLNYCAGDYALLKDYYKPPSLAS